MITADKKAALEPPIFMGKQVYLLPTMDQFGLADGCEACRPGAPAVPPKHTVGQPSCPCLVWEGASSGFGNITLILGCQSASHHFLLKLGKGRDARSCSVDRETKFQASKLLLGLPALSWSATETLMV